ncbi:SCO family protein [Flavobacteriaceae bacterium R38]|nr:SCO family protein [Flavobacteriaceae bacterium R38]
MTRFFGKFKYFLITLTILSVIIISLFYNALKPKETLAIFQPADVTAELVDESIQHVKKYHTIADFKFTNQNGKTITQEDYKDKIYIADFFFTTCPTICPIMTGNMTTLQEEFLNDDEVMLLSHSVTPEIDSVAQLKAYAIEKGVVDSKWNLITGDKKQIYDMARKSYLVAKENDAVDIKYDLIHTENFVLVDKKRRIRGFYDGTNEDDIQRLLGDIKILKAEYRK